AGAGEAAGAGVEGGEAVGVGGLGRGGGVHGVAPGEAAEEAAPELVLDEDLEIRIESLSAVPNATHSLLFEDEYADPESAALPLEAWTPLPAEELEGVGGGGSGDAGASGFEAAGAPAGEAGDSSGVEGAGPRGSGAAGAALGEAAGPPASEDWAGTPVGEAAEPAVADESAVVAPASTEPE